MDTLEESIICRICGDALGDQESLACRSCGTPHHKDCWEFAGSCSVYGCGSTRSTEYVLPLPVDEEHRIGPEEVLAINEDTPLPLAYSRRRDSFPSPIYFAVMAYSNSITGLKLFGTGFLIWFASVALGKIIQPFIFFAVAGAVLCALAPVYWIAASVLGIISLSTGLVDGRIERRAIYGVLIGSFIPFTMSLYADMGSLVIGGAAVLFAASFLFQLVRNAFYEKFRS